MYIRVDIYVLCTEITCRRTQELEYDKWMARRLFYVISEIPTQHLDLGSKVPLEVPHPPPDQKLQVPHQQISSGLCCIRQVPQNWVISIMIEDVDTSVVVLPRGHVLRHPIEASFIIHGAPIAQNGWKLAWKRNQRPVIYDSLQKQKIELRANIRAGLFDLLHQSWFPIFAHRTLHIEITFRMHNVYCKDIDNLMKFLLDAMQHVMYHNDSSIMSAVVKKVEAHEEDEESTFVKISVIDHSDSDSIYV